MAITGSGSAAVDDVGQDDPDGLMSSKAFSQSGKRENGSRLLVGS